MTGTMNTTQRTLAILLLLKEATAEQVADDDLWGGRWPDPQQVRATLDLLAECGKVQITDWGDGQTPVRYAVAASPIAVEEAERYVSVLGADPAVAYTAGGYGALE